MSVSGTSDLKDRAMGALSGGRETVGFSLSAGKVGGERASNEVFFFKGFEKTHHGL